MPHLHGLAPDLHHMPYPSRRSVVRGRRGMVATSQPLAAQAGLGILQAGGNAFDAAVATAAMLNVVEPTGTGVGGDCFALLYLSSTGTVRALNGSGRAPLAALAAELRHAGWSTMPQRGGMTVTVPGTVHAWETLLAAHGRLSLAEALAPAIAVAHDGYPVSELIAAAWQASEPLLAGHEDARRHYLPAGRAPRSGEAVRLPALAGTLTAIAEGGSQAFYHGPIASAIVATCQAAGGSMTLEDLARHTSTWDSPLRIAYRDLDIWECPPNGQGLAALVALGILDHWPYDGAAWGSAGHLHPLVEAMRLGFAAAAAWVADPAQADIPLDALLAAEHLARCSRQLWPDAAVAAPRRPQFAATARRPDGGDTVYLAVVDEDGNACSFINSNYMGFGSGLVAGDTGIALQNRGAGFVLIPGHPNELAPGKRPYHTIIPGLATRRSDQSLWAVFGVMGGHMQPQGHVQLVVNLVDYGLDPQRALDAPRFQLLADDSLALEPWFGVAARQALAGLGHALRPIADAPASATFGGGQLIVVDEDGMRHGGSDPRKDGAVAALP